MAAPEILLVDDAPDLGVIVTALGRRAGWRVDCRRDADAAWEYLDGATPDLILLDVNLPGVSGPQLCRRIRQTPRTEGLCVALFTHWGLPEDIVTGLEAGADYFVCKDLVVQPELWQLRVAEILPAEHGRGCRRWVRWKADVADAPTADWPGRLHSALCRPALRGVKPEVMRVVLRRALQAAFGPGSRASAVLADGRTLDPALVPVTPRPEQLVHLVACIAEQVWRLLGERASAPAWQALAGVVPGVPELLTA
jgi:CheY-like chemotaxis protein